MDPTSEAVLVGGHRLTLTHLEKVLYPETGTTKADVLRYYATVAPAFIPHSAGRPATRTRWVHGVGTETAPGPMFFQKNLEPGTPEWVERGSIRHDTRTNEYPLVNNLATLIWLAQTSALEVHVPQWRFGEDGTAQNPDRLVLDLDPGAGVSLTECAEVAVMLRALLTGMGLDPVAVTSGSTGIHLYAALDTRSTTEQVSSVAHELARALEADHPDLVVSSMKKSVRAGRVFIDWSQNNGAKTTIAPYSLRGRPRPTVAAPRSWTELAAANLAQLDYLDVMRRVAEGNDPLARLATAGSPDPPAAQSEDRQRASAHPAVPDRLAPYRAKRHPARTPEPVPPPADTTPTTATGGSYVVHEHHARRLHWDLRVEHDGVLACWALPKGVPTDSAHNHLAVRTEDHPLDYREFEGIIPAGQYGAGRMWIWDAGTTAIEKWHDDEVIVTLHPRPGGGLDGPRRFALIHTGTAETAHDNWLIHLMKADTGQRVAKPSPQRTLPVLSPMLATTGTPADLRPDHDWAIEMKWDGMRILARLTTEARQRMVVLRTRNGLDVTRYFPEVAAGLLTAVGCGAGLFDGEVVALDARGRPDFARLQGRMVFSAPPIHGSAAPRPPVTYLLFDALELDGESLLHRAYDDRRRILLGSIDPQHSVQVPVAFDGAIEAALRASRTLGLEGIVAKRHDSLYRAGLRSRAWIKITQRRTQEVVVGGWRPGRGNRADTIGSLLLGLPRGESLDYVGRVGTGFRDSDLIRVRRLLDASVATDCPFAVLAKDEAAGVTWVRPEFVGEVEFAEWTPAGRLRHPSWRGWRPDKSSRDITRDPAT